VSDQIERFYEESGYCEPAPAFERRDPGLADALTRIRSFADSSELLNRHFDIPEVAAICRCPAVIDRVRTILGPDLLLWRSAIFSVSATHQNLPWHQDSYRALLDPDGAPHCSVQINLTDASESNCVAIVPGSHRWSADDLDAGGYRIVHWNPDGTNVYAYAPQRRDQSREIRMRAGQFIVFHPMLLHASIVRPTETPTPGDATRYAISLRITTPSAKVLPAAFTRSPSRERCVLLSGTDSGGRNALGTWAA